MYIFMVTLILDIAYHCYCKKKNIWGVFFVNKINNQNLKYCLQALQFPKMLDKNANLYDQIIVMLNIIIVGFSVRINALKPKLTNESGVFPIVGSTLAQRF